MKVIRYISKTRPCSLNEAKQLILEGKVELNDEVVTSFSPHLGRWDKLVVEGEPMQSPKKRYYMMNKPAGYVSATKDDEHPTVLSLLPQALQEGLHIAGRLDRYTTGLLLLTNDGAWSRALSHPEKRVGKVYLVGVRDEVTAEYEALFKEGVYFEYEDITTQPAKLERLSPTQCRLTLHEGRYHQVKRMFGRFRNPVLSLHRESIGVISLDESLAEGEVRELTIDEVNSVAL